MAALGAPATALAATCGSAGFTVAPLHGSRFYIDSSITPQLTSGYTAVSVSPSAAQSNVWVQLSGFGGGPLGLNANQPAAIPLGNLSAASTRPAYFFLTASPVSETTTAQTFSVNVYRGDPSKGGTLICSYADGYSGGVYDAIQASANKVQDVTGDSVAASVSTSTPQLGGTVTLTVEGTTGTLGNGPDGVPFIYETPTSLASWPAGSFRLTGTTLTLSPGTAGATTYTNQLEVSDSSWGSAQDYVAQYTFQITGTTSSATAAYPIQEITSGTQVKHTNVSSLSGVIPAIQPASNPLTLTQSASPPTLPSTGGPATFTATLQSTSATASSIDEIVDTIPIGASYVTGSAKLNGAPIGDPTSSSGPLVFPGPFTVSTSSSQTVTYQLSFPAAPGTYTNSALAYVAATPIDTIASDTTGSFPATATVTVGKLAQTITYPQPPDSRVDQGPVTLSGTASSGLSVSYTSTSPSVCTVNDTSVTLLTTGTCTISADQTGNSTYAAAAPVSRSFQITAAPASPTAQTITFPQPPDTRVDQGPVTLSATASSGLSVSYTTTTPSVCIVSATSITLLATGTCSITADQAGNSTYAAASSVTRSFQITAAPASPTAQAISFPQPPDTAVDQGPVALGASASSGLSVSYTGTTPSVCTVAATSVTLLTTGTCTITADQAGNSSYAAAAPVPQSFEVTASSPGPTPTAQTISFPQPPDTAVDQGPVALGASASSGLTVSYTSTTPSVCTVNGTSVTLLTSGPCTLVASQPGDGSYAVASPVSRSFQVTAGPASSGAQTISFPQPPDTRIDQGPVSPSATANSGLAVSYTSTTPSVCAVSATSVTLLATGTCTITADQSGNSTYATASSVTRSFQITAVPAAAPPPATPSAPAPAAPAPGTSAPAAQVITFTQPSDAVVDAGSLDLDATASSGLSVTYTSLTPNVCRVSGSTVIVIATGTCSISARQNGDGAYGAAAPVSRSFAITAQLKPRRGRAQTTAGQTTSAALARMPAGATVKLAPSLHLPGVAAIHMRGTSVVLTPTQTFTGILTIPVLVSGGGQTTSGTIAVTVRPTPPTAAIMTPTSGSTTRISWGASPSARGYEVRIDGRIVCHTASTNCMLPTLLSANAVVTVTATGNAGTISLRAPAHYAAKPVLLAVVHFATGSDALSKLAKRILDATEIKIATDGFKHAILSCHTDNAGSLAYNLRLSRARCHAVASYITRHLGITHVTYQQDALAYLRPTAPNSSRTGMAKNRRVEIRVS
jgi:outer membrane protein OmpA-like peptidoglycan-associated protein